MNIVNVILSGGVGSRLWPLSRSNKPKQYLPLFSGKSLIDLTLERNMSLVGKVVIVGNEKTLEMNRAIKSSHEDIDLITEAVPRNTAAAIAFAAFACEPEDVLIVSPSDHLILNDQSYHEAICKAVSFALEGFIVTFGIVPTRPETGYGYIEANDDSVVSFHEKPNEALARKYIDNGNFLWNSGMFCFKAETLLNELIRYEPEIYSTSKLAWEKGKDGMLDLELSLSIPSKSIDYAVMERSNKLKVIKSHFEWNDMGSFESLYDYLIENGHPIDEQGNIAIGTEVKTKFLGLKNTIFVHTDDVNLILRKELSQDVKEIYDSITKTDPNLL